MGTTPNAIDTVGSRSRRSAVRINPRYALFIKLGGGGEWEQDCLVRSRTLRLGFNEAPHGQCLSGKWESIKALYRRQGKDRGTATRYADQIRQFYESDRDVLWITFHAGLLYYCFSKPQVKRLRDGSKIRRAVGGWRTTDVHGRQLRISELSGRLASVQAFRGTICKVKEFRYLVDRINGERPPHVQQAEQALLGLREKLAALIRSLHWKDFEIFVDLIFRGAGWVRVSALGETQKTLDLLLESPITGERFGIQVKSRAERSTFEDFKKASMKFTGVSRFYFVVHSPGPDLEGIQALPPCEILTPVQLAELATRYGLADWLIAKSG